MKKLYDLQTKRTLLFCTFFLTLLISGNVSGKNEHPTSISTISGSGTFCVGSTVNLSIDVLSQQTCGTGSGSASVTVRFYSNTNLSNTNGTLVFTASSYTASGGTVGTTVTKSYSFVATSASPSYYYAIVSYTSTGCTSAGSLTTTTAQMASVSINALPNPPTANNNTKSYTGTTNTTTISATPGSGETIDWYAASTGGTAITTGSNTYTPVAVNAGTYTYYAEAKNSNGCLSSSRTAVTLTITRLPITISATGPLKTYGTALAAGSSNTNFSLTSGSYATGQSIASVTLSPNTAGLSATTAAGLAYVVTPSAAVGAGGFSVGNYDITYLPYNGTVTAKPLTITATGPTKTYGTALPAGTSETNFTAGITGVGSEAVNSVTLTPDAAGLSATTAAGVAFVVTPSLATGTGGFLESNYNITYTSYSGIVAKKALAITEPTIAPKEYNASATAGAVTVGELSGLVSPETLTATAVAADYSSPNAGSYPSTVVTYTLADGTDGGLAANYSLENGTATGEITSKPLSVTDPMIASKEYNGSSTSGAVTVGTLSGFVGTETVTATAVGTFADANVGTGKSATIVYTLEDGVNGGLAINYSLANGSGSGDISQKPLTITANGPTKTYGTALTAVTSTTNFTADATGVGSEVVTSVTLTPDAAGLSATTAAGLPYVVTPSQATGTGGFLASNYNIIYTDYNGTVSKAPMSITATNLSKVFDGAPYSGVYPITFETFVNSDSEDDLTMVTPISGSWIGAVNVGPYSVIPPVYTSTNYEITYHNGIFTIDAPSSLTWDGSTDSDWNISDNWTPPMVPTAEISVSIPNETNDPIISSTTTAECNGLTIATGATLTINSDAGNSGSLIAHGSTSGDVTYNRYMTGGRWYITSAPVHVNSGFGTANATKIVSHGDPTIVDYDFATYTESGNVGWQYQPSLPSSLNSGEGYLVTLSSDNSLAFTGALNGDFTKSLASSSADDGWNAVGNPYTSAIKIKGTGGFIESNALNLDENYAAIYVWNETDTYTEESGGQYYRIIGNSGYSYTGITNLEVDNVQVGQGFLVNSKVGGGTVSFTKAMQVSATGLSLKSAETSWPGITLLAEANGKTRSTVVAFNDQMTTGLDVTYDAGLLASDNFQVYTRLVGGNNDVDFAIQCLPENQYNQLSVPVGLDLPEGGELAFKASGVILRDGLYPVIEDRLLGIQTALKTATDSYTVTLDKNTSGIGRFYLSVADVTTSKPIIRQENKYTASLVNNRIVLNGAVEAGTKATLYDICGRKVGEYPLAKMNRNEIPVSGLSQRVYLLKVEGSNYRQVIKLLAINY